MPPPPSSMPPPGPADRGPPVDDPEDTTFREHSGDTPKARRTGRDYNRNSSRASSRSTSSRSASPSDNRRAKSRRSSIHDTAPEAQRRPSQRPPIPSNPTPTQSDQYSDPDDLYADAFSQGGSSGSQHADNTRQDGSGWDVKLPGVSPKHREALSLLTEAITKGASSFDDLMTWSNVVRRLIEAMREGCYNSFDHMTDHHPGLSGFISDVAQLASDTHHVTLAVDRPFINYHVAPKIVEPLVGHYACKDDARETKAMLRAVLDKLSAMPNATPQTQPAAPNANLSDSINRMSTQIANLQGEVKRMARSQSGPPPSSATTTATSARSTAVNSPAPTQNSNQQPAAPPHANTGKPPTIAQVAAAGVSTSPNTAEKWTTVQPKKKTMTDPAFILTLTDKGDLTERKAPPSIVAQINDIFKANPVTAQRNLRLLGAEWTKQGNCKLTFPHGTAGAHVREAEHLFRHVITADRFATLSIDTKWSKIVFRNALTRPASDAAPYPMEAYKEDLAANTFVREFKLDITQQPFFVRKDAAANNDTAELAFAFNDPDGSIAKAVLQKYKFGFIRGLRTFMRPWHEKSALKQCEDGCWQLGHEKKRCGHPTKFRCRICAKVCNSLVLAQDHRTHCAGCKKDNNTELACPHPPHCAVCEGEHPANHPACPARRKYRTPQSDAAAAAAAGNAESSGKSNAMET
jgi:hypothetical protein